MGAARQQRRDTARARTQREQSADGFLARLRGLLRRRRLLALGSTALATVFTLWLGGVLGDVGARSVDAIFGEDSPKPAELELQRLPQGTLAQNHVGGDGVVVPAPLEDIPRPPPRDEVADRPSMDAEFDRWVREVDAADAYTTSVDFVAQYTSDDPLLITDIRPVVVERRAPIEGTQVAPYGGTGVDARLISFNLDDDNAQPTQENPISGEQWRFPLRIAKGDDEFFSIIGRTEAHDVTWFLEIDYVLGGEELTARVDNDGQPFRTSATTAVDQQVYFPTAQDPWPPVDRASGG